MSGPPAGAGAVTDATSLTRRLGPIDGAAIVVSNVIGGGIFFVPIIVASLVPSGWAALAVWVFGGVLAFAGAMAYAELASLRPQAGGEYVYLRAAYGQLAAFLTGWTSFVAGFSGAIAAGALVLAGYLGRFIPMAGDTTALLTLPLPFVALVVSPKSLVAIAAVVSLSVIHVGGTGRAVHNLLAALKVTAILIFIAIGLSLGSGAMANVGSTHVISAPATAWAFALVPVMFSYSGWNAAAYVAEEIRNPGRNVPLALGLGTLAVIVIYLLLNILFLYAMPLAELAALDTSSLTDTVADRLFGFVAGNVIAAFTIVSLAASISAMVWAGPRVYYAMARDGAFFRSAARVHSTHRTPVVAIFAQALWSCILVLSGTPEALVTYTGFAVVLFAGAAVLALFVLRIREPGADRPFSALGYPIAPALFVVASAAMVVDSVARDPNPSLTGLAVILAGVPVYWLFRRQLSADRT